MPRVAPIDRSHFQPVPLLRMEPVFLPMPDFALRSVDSHVANKAEQRFEPKSNLVKTVWQQFPPQPPWPPMHPALRAFQNKALQIFREAPANFFITDEIFYDRVREQSVEFDKLRRWMARILHEKGVSETYAKTLIENEWERLQSRIKSTHDLMMLREKRNLFARFNSLEEWARARDLRWKIQKEWGDTRQWLIERGFQNIEESRDHRLSHLFTFNDPSLVVQLPRQGRPLEEVLGKIHRLKVLAELELNHQWRFGTSYITLPNGGVIGVEHGGGKSQEHVKARISWPTKDQRSEEFLKWHATRFKIQSPNGVPIEAPRSQGHLPENTEARIHDPILAMRTAEHQDYHRSGDLITLPNGGVSPLPDVGKIPEKVQADIFWSDRDTKKIPTDLWRERNLYTRQGDQSFAVLPEGGKSLEHVIGDIAASHRHKRDDFWSLQVQNNQYGETANGGISRLRESGNRLEEVAGQKAADLIFGERKNVTEKSKSDLKDPAMILDDRKRLNNDSLEKPSPPDTPLPPLTGDPLRDEILQRVPTPRHKAIKAFQATMEQDNAAAMGRLQAHISLMPHPHSLQNGDTAPLDPDDGPGKKRL